jgi:hypothetical protein
MLYFLVMLTQGLRIKGGIIDEAKQWLFEFLRTPIPHPLSESAREST